MIIFIFFSGIAVGLYHEYGHEEISRVALECKADIIVVENEALLKKVLLIQHKLPDLRAIVQLQGDPPLSDKRRLHKSHKVCKNLHRQTLPSLDVSGLTNNQSHKNQCSDGERLLEIDFLLESIYYTQISQKIEFEPKFIKYLSTKFNALGFDRPKF